MRDLITIPNQERSTRERLTEVRSMKSRIVTQKVVDLKTYKGLRKVEGLLVEKKKLEEQTSPKPSAPKGPKGAA